MNRADGALAPLYHAYKDVADPLQIHTVLICVALESAGRRQGGI